MSSAACLAPAVRGPQGRALAGTRPCGAGRARSRPVRLHLPRRARSAQGREGIGLTTTAQARQIQSRLLQIATRGTRAERQALCDAMAAVAKGSRDQALMLACRGALAAVGA